MNRILQFAWSLVLIAVCTSVVNAEPPSLDDGYNISVPLLIVRSTADYPEALRYAKKASATLRLKLDLRGLGPHDGIGLTSSQEDCEPSGGFPCYYPRGRLDDGAYVSIEYSSAFRELKAVISDN